MDIDKIGPVKNYNGYNKVNKKNPSKDINLSDSVNISKEALDMAETSRIMDIVKSAPDIRTDKINEIKAKINNPDYINKEVIDKVAEKILESL